MTLFRHSRGAFEIKSMSEDSPSMEFVMLYDADDQLHLSKETYNCGTKEEGGFPYRFAIKAFDMAEYVGVEEVGRESPLYIELYVVSPEAAGGDEIKRALDSCGWEDMPKNEEAREDALCEVLLNYGTAAGIYSLIGGHARVFSDGWWEEPEGVDLNEELGEGVNLMKQHAQFVHLMFGFFMDVRLNAVGATGWDWVKGDITGSLKKASE